MGAFESALGKTIAERRLSAGLTQEALAYKAHLHPTYLSQLERGLKSPTIRVLALIAHALGLPASELLWSAEIQLSDKDRTTS